MLSPSRRVVSSLLLGVFLALGGVFLFQSYSRGGKKEIIIGLSSEPSSLDPRSNPSAVISQITLYNVYETLVKVDSSGEVVPGLASSWRKSQDGKTWDFYLRPATFHNGEDFTSADVVWTFDRNKDDTQGNPRKGFFQGMKEIEAITPGHVRITLEEYKNEFMHHISGAAAVIVERGSADRNKSKPIGTGPYMFVEWKPGEAVVMKKSPYFEGDLAFERVVQRFYKDQAPMVAAMRSGDVDYIPYVDPEYVSFFENSEDFELVKGNTYGEVIVALNNKSPILKNKEVRQAMMMAINRENVIDVVLDGYGNSIGSHYTVLQDFYLDLNQVYAHNKARGKRLIERYKNKNRGKDIQLRMLIPGFYYARKGSQVVTEMLSDVGVKVSTEVLDWPRWMQEVYRDRDYDMTIIAHVEFMDILNYARPDYYWGYEDKDFQELAEKIEKEVSRDMYRIYLEQAQRKIGEEVPNLFLFELPRLSVRKKGITGTPVNDPVFAVEVASFMHR